MSRHIAHTCSRPARDVRLGLSGSQVSCGPMAWRTERGFLLRRLASPALMPAAAIAVHQLRYWFAFGRRANAVLLAQGHAYLHSLTPWLVLLLATAVGGFLAGVGEAMAGQRSLPRYTVSFAALWLLCAACLVAIYASQELLEGLLVGGHPAGLAGVFGYGGWWAVPAALSVGLVLAAVLHGARWALDEVARRYGACVPIYAALNLNVGPPRAVLVCRPEPVAGGWSGRGPPR